MAQKKSNRKPAAKRTATKKTAVKKKGARKAAKKAAAPERNERTQFRAVCLTEGKKLSSWTTDEQAAENERTKHEASHPDHVTDIEEKG